MSFSSKLFIALTIWGAAFLPFLLVSSEWVGYLGAIWGVIFALIGVVGIWKGKLLGKSSKGYVFFRIYFGFSLLFLAFSIMIGIAIIRS